MKWSTPTRSPAERHGRRDRPAVRQRGRRLLAPLRHGARLQDARPAQPGGRSRYLGTGAIFGNIELRRLRFTSKNAASASLILYVDVGRVFEGEKVRLTGDELHVGAGAGLALRILRSTSIVFDVARGSDGMRFNIGSGWAF